MLSQAFSPEEKPSASRDDPHKQIAIEIVGNGVADILSVSGRIALSGLKKIHLLLDREAFIRYVQQPVLAGSAILSGTLGDAISVQTAGKNQTMVFDLSSWSEEGSGTSDALQNAIYPLVKDTISPSANSKMRFSVGRDSANDIIMPDIALSKFHAVIEVTNHSYFVSDCGSTNGTMLNGQRLDQASQPLDDGDILSFARYEFTFLFPESLYNKLGYIRERVAK